jgi:hypothetical protein
MRGVPYRLDGDRGPSVTAIDAKWTEPSRDELSNETLSSSLRLARVHLEEWRGDYNIDRTVHSAI